MSTLEQDLNSLSQYQKRQLVANTLAVVGVDAGKYSHTLVIRPHGGADSKPVTFPTDREGFDRAVRTILATVPGASPDSVLVGIEFAGSYGFTFAHYLRARGFLVASVLSVHTKRWKEVTHSQPLKTDARDAAVITDLLAQGKFVGFAFLATPYAELRQLVSAREHVATLRTAAINRLISVLDVVFPEYLRLFQDVAKPTALAVLKAFPGPSAILAAPRRRALQVIHKASLGHLGEERYEALVLEAQRTLAVPGIERVAAEEIRLIVARLELYNAQLTTLKKYMIRAMEPLPEAAALLTIPYVAPVSAATFLGSVGDPRAYASSAQVLKLAGLSLVERSSGLTRGELRISKRGKPVLRRQAFMFALRSVSRDGLFRADFDRLVAQNGGCKISALTAISRKGLTLMFSVARDRRAFVPTEEWRARTEMAVRTPPSTRPAGAKSGRSRTRRNPIVAEVAN